MEIIVNCQNSILINKNIYIDPLNIEDIKKAKYIFVTHPHFDHFSVNDIHKILTNDTKLICPKAMQEEAEKAFHIPTIFVEPNHHYELGDISFDTFAAYNVNKKFHPKENNWVGYTLNVDNIKVTIVGDSDDTLELRKVKTDILLLPIGGHFTMDYTEAAKLTNAIHPKKVIPTHYGSIIGNKEMGKAFQDLIDKDIECELQLG